MMIDIATLSLILIILGIMQVIVFFLLVIKYNHFAGIKACLVGCIIMTVGAFSMYLRYIYIDNSFYITLSNLIIVAGLTVICSGLLKFLGKKVNKGAMFYVLAVYLFGFLFFKYVTDNTNIRIMLFSFCYAVISVLLAVELLSGKKADRMCSARMMGTVMLLGGIYFFGRGVLSAYSADMISFYTAAGFQVTAFVSAIVISYLWSFSLVMMIFERINIEKNKAQKRFQDIYETIPDLICLTEIDSGVIVDANDKFIERMGASKQDVIGKDVFETSIWKNKQARQEYIGLVARDGRIENYEVEIMDKNGSAFTGLISGRLLDNNGKTNVLSIIRDISIRKGLERELQLQAQTDILTGISNRRHFFKSIENEILHSKSTMNESVFMMIDIDRFKKVNDKFGHAIGDAAMKLVAVSAKSVLRHSDLFGRVGGDEFGVLLVNTNSGEAERIAERMSRNVKDIDLTNDEGVKVYLRISIGITKYHHDEDTIEEMLARADKALYEAKEAGRNKIVANW